MNKELVLSSLDETKQLAAKSASFLKDPDIAISLDHHGETTRKCEVKTSLGLNL